MSKPVAYRFKSPLSEEGQPEQEQEPVAWMVYSLDGESVCVTDNPADFSDQHKALPLYTAAPQRKPLRTVIYACPICAASLERQE